MYLFRIEIKQTFYFYIYYSRLPPQIGHSHINSRESGLGMIRIALLHKSDMVTRIGDDARGCTWGERVGGRR